MTGGLLVVAPGRAARPHDTGPAPVVSEVCPFCEGHEDLTPPETFAVRAAVEGRVDGPGWTVRAFANRFPFVSADDGVHEVVVTTPRHVTGFGQLTDTEATAGIDAWAQRIRAVEADRRELWPFVFLNEGAVAGASLSHSHAQVVGLPFAPPDLVARERAFASGPCPICVEVAAADRRVVAEAGGLVAWCPSAPPLSGAVRIAPRSHIGRWSSEPRADMLGPLVRRVTAAIAERVSGALNIWIHDGRDGVDFHWHMELVPRIGTLAGLELGTGVLALTHDPTAMADTLRMSTSGAGHQ